MLTELGYNNSLILNMDKYGSMPSADKLGQIAEYLDVSVDYLLGRTDNPAMKTDFRAEHKELISLWDKLDPIDQARFEGELMGYLKAKEK